MARRDVDLVVRARDEAAKVIDTITKAFAEFNAGQQATETRAGKTESALSKLGTAFSQIQQVVGDTTGIDRLNQSFEKAKGGYDRVRESVDKTRQSFAQSERALKATDDALARHTAKLEGSRAAYERQQGVIQRTKAAQTVLAAELRRTEAAYARANAAQEKLPAQIERQNVAVSKASERYAKLRTELDASTAPSKRLQESFEATGAVLDRQQGRLEALRTKYAGFGTTVTESVAKIANLKTALSATETEMAQQDHVLSRISTGMARWSAQVAETTKYQRSLVTEVNKTGTALAGQEGDLTNARASLARFTAESKEADAALQRLGAQGAQAIRRGLLESVRELRTSETVFAGMTSAATKLATEIGEVGVPTRAMVSGFERAKVSAREAKDAMLLQRQEVNELRQAYAKIDGSLTSVEQANREFAQVQNQTRQAMQATAAAAERQRAAIAASVGTTERASGAARNNAAATRAVGVASNEAVGGVNRLRQAYNQLYGGSRQSLSLLQRVRGEVLALTASYVGLFAVFQGVGGVVSAIQRMEAAQSRLNVVFEGDQQAAAQEMDFLRRNADRLGISFAVLSDLYTKFAVASRGTNLEGAATRDIFIAVAEAARVNKSSIQQIELTFLALEQIVSKGTVSMEELRRQLGDQLPGAFNIMAEAAANAGLITDRFATDELTTLIENGQLSSDILTEFADVLRSRFGPGLEAAMGTVTTAFGRFTNAAFQATLAVGRGGFEDAMIRLLDRLTEFLQSGQAISIAERIGAAMATMAGYLEFAADNFTLLAAAAGAFIGIKLVPAVVALSASFVAFRASMLASGTAFVAWRAGLAGVTTSATVATTAAVGLRGALAFLLSPAGAALAVPAIAIGLALWATRTNEATDALVQHREIVDQIKNAYEAAEGAIDAWRDGVVDIPITLIRAQLDALRESTSNLTRDILAEVITSRAGTLNVIQGIFGGGSNAGAAQMQALVQQYREGSVSARELRDELDLLNEQFVDGDDELVALGRSLSAQVQRLVDLEDATREAELAVIAKTGSDAEAAAALRELTGATEDQGDAAEQATRINGEYQDALRELQGLVPSIADELRQLEEVAALTTARDAALGLAQDYGQVVAVLQAFQQGLDGINNTAMTNRLSGLGGVTGTSDGVEASMALLRDREGFRSTPYWDVNADRIGYGSDTVTLSDGSVRAVTEGMRITLADAERDLERRVRTEFMPQAQGQAGADRFAQFNAQQQAALTSIAYNYGSLPDRILDAVRTGTDAEISTAIRSLAGDNAGVNSTRRNLEADLFVTDAGQPAAIRDNARAQAEAARDAERQAEAQTRVTETISGRIADVEFENSLSSQNTADAEVARVLRQAENEAQRVGLTLTQEQRAQLEAVTRERVAQEEATRATSRSQREVNVELEAAQAAQEQVNLLTQQQAAMQQEMAAAEEGGNTARVEELRAGIAAVNVELLAAIDNAIGMWEAVGGQASVTAIAQLQAARQEAANFTNEAQRTQVEWRKVGDLLVNGLVNAFDKFARAVAEGQDVGEAAREAFLQFAADFLIEIGKMIVQQMILNLLRGMLGGTSLGATIGLGHTGGMVGSARVGSGNQSRSVNPGMFASAMRYHEGGVAGLRPGEVPIIAQQGEEILTKDDPRHMFNSDKGQSQAASKSMKIVNAFSASDMLSEALGSSDGEEVILNWVRRNSTSVKAVLG